MNFIFFTASFSKISFYDLLGLKFLTYLLADEANKLMDWTEPGSLQQQLKYLLNFLVSISKEANLVHVILATSDHSLATWLDERRF